MKKLQFLFAVVILAATLSAFTTKLPEETAFRLADGSFVNTNSPMTGYGCIPHEEFACTYKWVGEVSEDRQDPDNYEPVEGQEEKYYGPVDPNR